MSQNQLRHPGGTFDELYSGGRIYTKTFYVENIRPEEIEWGVGIPAKHDEHPNFPNAKARSKRAVPHGDTNGSAVTVRYTTPEMRNAQIPRPEPEPLTQHALIWSMNFHSAEVTIPAAILEEVTQPASWNLNLPFLVARYWRIDEVYRVVFEARSVLRVRWRLNSPSMGAASLLALHHNRIHVLPDGKKWRFTASGLVPVSTTEYVASAQWELDLGTPILTFFNGTSSPKILLPRTGLDYATGQEPPTLPVVLIRSPYYDLHLTLQPDNNAPLAPDPPIVWQSTVSTDDSSLYSSWETGPDALPQFPGFG